MSTTYKLVVFLLFIVVFISSHNSIIVAKPTDGYKQTKVQCGPQEKIYLCQKCAKITKANNVYPNCCSENDDDVYKWCKEYIYFGQHLSPPQFQ